MKDSFFVFSLALLVGTGILAWTEHRTAGEINERRSTVIIQERSARADLDRVLRELKTAEESRDGVQRALSKIQDAPGKTSQQPRNPLLVADNSPKIQLLKQNARRASLDGEYAAFFRRHPFTVEQRNAFKDNLLQREQTEDDLAAIARSKQISRDDPEIKALLDQAAEQYQQQQRQMLGESTYRDLLEYQRSLPAREYVGGVAAAAMLNGVPFTPDQVEQITALVAAASPSFQNGKTAEIDKTDWEVVDAQLHEIVPEAQANAFRTTPSLSMKKFNSRALMRLNDLISRAAAADRKG